MANTTELSPKFPTLDTPSQELPRYVNLSEKVLDTVIGYMRFMSLGMGTFNYDVLDLTRVTSISMAKIPGICAASWQLLQKSTLSDIKVKVLYDKFQDAPEEFKSQRYELESFQRCVVTLGGQEQRDLIAEDIHKIHKIELCIQPGTEENRYLQALDVTNPIDDRTRLIATRGGRAPGTDSVSRGIPNLGAISTRALVNIGVPWERKNVPLHLPISPSGSHPRKQPTGSPSASFATTKSHRRIRQSMFYVGCCIS
ncbi:hypothetical protein BKA56DRAFT_693324 [Ilyonectria sp. MPI-CAGE-AT-0026]|nr:hypothetical protein BKA56DRAFT_693324 [Ilyonectria sp. MPI-CAGE-AT-0026]